MYSHKAQSSRGSERRDEEKSQWQHKCHLRNHRHMERSVKILKGLIQLTHLNSLQITNTYSVNVSTQTMRTRLHGGGPQRWFSILEDCEYAFRCLRITARHGMIGPWTMLVGPDRTDGDLFCLQMSRAAFRSARLRSSLSTGSQDKTFAITLHFWTQPGYCPAV